jgi:polyisoprenoid-binding protein YceI
MEPNMTAPALSTRTFDGLSIPEPGAFTLDPNHTTVGFVARHLVVSKVRGSFTDVSGTVTVAEDVLASTVDVVIGAASFTTGVADRDNHVRGGDFLDVEHYPTVTFRSLGLSRGSGSSFTLTGELTIRGATRPVELAVEFEGVVRSPWGREVIAFTATGEIDREEFGITWNQALETGGVLVGKTVRIEIAAEAVRQV